MRRLLCAILVTIGLAALPATAQTMRPGDSKVTLSYSYLDRSDQGTRRDTEALLLTYTYQWGNKWQFEGLLGRIDTMNFFPTPAPAAEQSTETPTIGLGARYQIAPGTRLTGYVIYGEIDERFASGGFTTTGSGDTLTFSIQIDQVVPLSSRTFLAGSLGYAHSRSDFQTAGFSTSPTTNRGTAAIGLTHILNRAWSVRGTLQHSRADNIITITGDDYLNRASIGAVYRVTPDIALSADWTQGINAENTHQRLDLSVSYRF